MQLLSKIPGVEVTTIAGAPMTVDEFTLTPIAQKIRWRGTTGSGYDGGASLLYLRPLAVHVTTRNGAEQEIAISTPTTRRVRTLGSAALALAGGCAIVMAVTGRTRRKVMEKKDATGNGTGHCAD